MSQTKILAVLASALCCVLVPSQEAWAGDVYRTIDASGRPVLSDRPSPGAVLVSTGAQRPPEVAQRMQAAARAADSAQINASNQRIATAQSNSQAASTVARDLEASRTERCEKAKAFYQNTINSQRLYRTKEDGSREYLSDQELAQARVDALQARNAICGPQG